MDYVTEKVSVILLHKIKLWLHVGTDTAVGHQVTSTGKFCAFCLIFKYGLYGACVY